MAIQKYDGRGELTRERNSFEPSRFEVPADSRREDLQYYLGALLRRWWIIVSIGLIAWLGGWWRVRDAIPMYTAGALLQQRSEVPVLGGLLTKGSESFASHLEIIRSRTVLRPVVDSLGLQLRLIDRKGERTRLIESSEVAPAAPRGRYGLQMLDGKLVLDNQTTGEVLGRFTVSDTVTGPGFRIRVARPTALVEPLRFSIRDHERTTESLRGKLRIHQGLGPDLIWIRWTNADPQHAANVVNAVANRYRQYRAATARQVAIRRRAVIVDELVLLADSLRNVQDRLLEYQRSQEMLNPLTEDAALLQERLNTEAGLRDLEFQERMLQTLVAELQLNGPSEALQQRLLAMGNTVVPGGAALQQRLQGLMDQRNRLTASRFGYTENAPDVQTLDNLIAGVKRQMQVAAAESLNMLRAKISSTETRLGQVRVGVSSAPGETAEFGRLQQRVVAVQRVYDVLVGEYYQAQIAEAVESGDVIVVDMASVPLYPDPTRAPLKMTLALLAGLMIGSLLVLALEQFDKSIRSAADVERAVQAPVLGTVPRIRSHSPDALQMRLGKEAFRSIRTNLRFAFPSGHHSLTITSAAPGEGKSTVASNLTLALAEQGLRVVLIDADLRRPRIHELFDMRLAPGLTELLRGQAELDDAIQRHSVLPALHVIPGGKVDHNATELVGSEAFPRLLSELDERYDIVVIDTAPILAFTDAALISLVSDGTVLVARARQTEEGALQAAARKLQRLDVKLVGVILNGVPVDKTEAYYYEYYDGERSRLMGGVA